MAQCLAKTKDGNLCQIPARDGQTYCHIHRNKRIWRRISGSALGAIFIGVLSFVANITGVLGYFGIFPDAGPATEMARPVATTISPKSTKSIIAVTPGITPLPVITSSPAITRTLGVGVTELSKLDGMLYLFVPPGDFVMGSNNGFADEKPEHKVFLGAFWIAQTEVTNAMYSMCVEANVCRPPSRTDYYSRDASSSEYPVVFISWNDAKSYCEWTGARLPTEAEWEKAARGQSGLIYPWGAQFDCRRGNFDDETGEDANVVAGGPNCDGYNYIAPVGSFPDGKSVYGILDMSGNVWEWVSDWYGDSYYQTLGKQPKNPVGPEDGVRRVVKGGAWLNDRDVFFRGSNRYSYPPELVDDNVGFRCVRPEE